MENNQFHDNSFNQVYLQGNLGHLTDHRASQNDHFKEVYQYPQSDWSKELSQQVLDAPYSHPKAYPGPGAPNPPQHVDRESYPEALAGQHPYTGPVEEPRATHTRLSKYKWLILLVVVIIVVGAAIGGALGRILGKRTNNSSTSSSSGPGTVGTNSTSTAGWPVLKTSNLAATNWTDNDGNAFHAVFWQSASNHLIVSTFNGSIGNWTATNISSTASTTALPGTPLAAAVRGLQFGSFGPFGIALFYITPDNVLAEVYSTDPAARTWQIGGLSQSDVSWQAASGSQLAARWDLCGLSGCSGDLLLAYEDEQQSLRLANSSDWAATPGTLVTSITPSSPLAMTAIDRIQPTSLDRWDGASSARLYFEELQTLQQWGWDDESGSWYNSAFNLLTAEISHADRAFTTQPIFRSPGCPSFRQR
jgi:hypothetical protein